MARKKDNKRETSSKQKTREKKQKVSGKRTRNKEQHKYKNDKNLKRHPIIRKEHHNTQITLKNKPSQAKAIQKFVRTNIVIGLTYQPYRSIMLTIMGNYGLTMPSCLYHSSKVT